MDDAGERARGDVASEEAQAIVMRDFRAGLADLDLRMAWDRSRQSSASIHSFAGQFAPLWQEMLNSKECFADSESAELFKLVFTLDFPGLERGSPEWDAELTRTWRLTNLGRWAFSAILQHVRDSCMAELHGGSSAGHGLQDTAISAAAKELCRQQQDGSHLKVEAELLLKELGIGRRAREIETWSGAVSAVAALEHASVEEEASGEVAEGGEATQVLSIPAT